MKRSAGDRNAWARVRVLPSLKRLTLLLLLVVPLAAWVFVKPIRMIAPDLMGLTCPSPSLCIDDVAQLASAESLYSEALSYVSANISSIERPPRIIFCSSQACAQSFGLGARSAVTLGTWGIIVSPRAWKPHYLRHELIHHLQAERIGVLPLLFKPSWFVEGMAYALSQDPRATLAEPWESDRQEFRVWYHPLDQRQLWVEAERL